MELVWEHPDLLECIASFTHVQVTIGSSVELSTARRDGSVRFPDVRLPAMPVMLRLNKSCRRACLRVFEASLYHIETAHVSYDLRHVKNATPSLPFEWVMTSHATWQICGKAIPVSDLWKEAVGVWNSLVRKDEELVRMMVHQIAHLKLVHALSRDLVSMDVMPRCLTNSYFDVSHALYDVGIDARACAFLFRDVLPLVGILQRITRANKEYVRTLRHRAVRRLGFTVLDGPSAALSLTV